MRRGLCNSFQETYNSDKYETLHLAGHKRIFPYRMEAQERAIRGGMRGVGLLLYWDLMISEKMHLQQECMLICYRENIHMQRLLFPVRGFARSSTMIRSIRWMCMKTTLQVVTAYRLFMPYASITVSTRECARVRDSLMEIAATKISAGVSTGIGSHAKGLEDQGDEQFEISDGRTVKQVYDALLEEGLQPVMSDYIYV